MNPSTRDRRLRDLDRGAIVTAKISFTPVVIAALLIGYPLFAGDKPNPSAGPPVCGQPNIQFEVGSGGAPSAVQAEPGRALVYFLEDDSNFSSWPKPTTRAAIDGNWVGANHGSSYFVVSVDPGVHHLCVNWQSKVIIEKQPLMAAAHFTAEPGGVYYFQVRNTFGAHNGVARLMLEPIDSYEGALLAQNMKVSSSHPKK